MPIKILHLNHKMQIHFHFYYIEIKIWKAKSKMTPDFQSRKLSQTLLTVTYNVEKKNIVQLAPFLSELSVSVQSFASNIVVWKPKTNSISLIILLFVLV